MKNDQNIANKYSTQTSFLWTFIMGQDLDKNLVILKLCTQQRQIGSFGEIIFDVKIVILLCRIANWILASTQNISIQNINYIIYQYYSFERRYAQLDNKSNVYLQVSLVKNFSPNYVQCVFEKRVRRSGEKYKQYIKRNKYTNNKYIVFNLSSCMIAQNKDKHIQRDTHVSIISIQFSFIRQKNKNQMEQQLILYRKHNKIYCT
eukprot:TRINITY_DN8221_c0_g1_i1.p6 TRINITY_DN8221_c0_g1~~TRINITY_DN8221_c0_g1_i1.p6  ORF type:complete len:204 (+),score=-16.24 TRINITY_DN8221_c0_g1_i1:925-1536(+)